MAFERVKKIVDKKLAAMGLHIKYKIRTLSEGESYSSNRSHVVYINPIDAKSKMMARQNLQHILFHEVGHIFANDNFTKKIKKDPKFFALFGDLTKHYSRDMRKKFRHIDFVSTYAQVHPSDNFCEAFAVYCTFEGNLKEIFKHVRKNSEKVRKQMRWINKFIKQMNN
jgi:hypothetical protein